MKSSKKSNHVKSPASKSVVIPIKSQAQPAQNEVWNRPCECQGHTCPFYVCISIIGSLFVAIVVVLVLGIMKIVQANEPVVELGPQ